VVQLQLSQPGETSRPLPHVPLARFPQPKEIPIARWWGAGLKLQFSMQDTDPFIPHIPYKYEFQIMKTDTTAWVIPGLRANGFLQPAFSNETGKINEYLLTRYTTPFLEYDYDTARELI
jgi:hypothetical protein